MSRTLSTPLDFTSTRYCEANFRRFEHDLMVIISNFPRPTTITPISLRPSSYKAYLNGAITAYLSPFCPWTSSSVPKHRLQSVISSGFTVKLSANNITVGPRESIHLNESQVHGVNATPNEAYTAFTIDASDLDVLRAMALLKSRDIILGECRVTNFNSELSSVLSSSFPNLAFAVDDADPTTAIMI